MQARAQPLLTARLCPANIRRRPLKFEGLKLFPTIIATITITLLLCPLFQQLLFLTLFGSKMEISCSSRPTSLSKSIEASFHAIRRSLKDCSIYLNRLKKSTTFTTVLLLSSFMTPLKTLGISSAPSMMDCTSH